MGRESGPGSQVTCYEYHESRQVFEEVPVPDNVAMSFPGPVVDEAPAGGGHG